MFNGDRAHVGVTLNVWDKIWLTSLTLFTLVMTVVNILQA